QAGRAAQVAAEVGPERGECDRDGDEPHDLAEQLPSVALDRLAAESRVVVGGPERAHRVTPDCRLLSSGDPSSVTTAMVPRTPRSRSVPRGGAGRSKPPQLVAVPAARAGA